MNGSQINQTERQNILIAMQTPPKNGYFVWDEQDEEDHPLTREEMLAGIMANIKHNNPNYFRFASVNWQAGIDRALIEINHALKEWLREHSIV